MLTKLFSVHDVKANAYLPPFTMRTNAEAIRAFDTTCKDKSSQFSAHPSDFTLCLLGEFNSETGLLSPMETPLNLARATDHV